MLVEKHILFIQIKAASNMADINNIMILAAGMSSRMKNSVDQSLDQQQIQDANIKPKSMLSVGKNGRPFMDYLIHNISVLGYQNICIVINEKDHITEKYYQEHSSWDLDIHFATQFIPAGRSKPLGTADAVLQGLKQSNWDNLSFTVCNSDNLYSEDVLSSLRKNEHPQAMIAYDRDSLGVEAERINSFAVIKKNERGFLTDIVEKPTSNEIQSVMDIDGRVNVSMNIFKLDQEVILPFLEDCPLHPIRNEKELPIAIKNMV